MPGDGGWTWDETAVGSRIGRGDVVELLAARIGALPRPTQQVLEIAACLGGQVELGLLQSATGLTAEELETLLAPALEDGLLVMELGGTEAVRFRHDRVQQAAHGRLGPASRRDLHLTLARRLAARPEFGGVAAELYLSAADAVQRPDERRQVARLFRAAAASALLIDPAMAERFLTAATTLLGPVQAADAALLAALEIDRHAALYRLGRLAEADEVYASIERRDPDPLERAASGCVQISGLASRNRNREAVDLGLDLLRRLGLGVPRDEDLGAEIGRGLNALTGWVEEDDQVEDLRRPEATDPYALAVASVMNRTMPPAYVCDQAVLAWLVVEARRLWVEHGPCAALVTLASTAPIITIALRQDFRSGYSAVRRVLAEAEARGYEPTTSQARFMFGLSATHWFQPLEEAVVQVHRAREGLVRHGDPQYACLTFFASVPALLDCAPTLDATMTEVGAGFALAARTGSDQTAAFLLAYQQLGRTLRGETDLPGSFADASFDEAAYLADLAANPPALCAFHVIRALAAAVFGNVADLAEHATAAARRLPALVGTYPTALVHLLHGLALADRVRSAPLAARPALLAELDTCRDWLAARAADAPGNFRHLVRLVEAERAWAVTDFQGAVAAFDAAAREAESRRRPWHWALIAERAARFHLEHGIDRIGRALLREARRGYLAWGATGKVGELDREYPFLPALAGPAPGAGTGGTTGGGTVTVPSDAIDLLGVLQASQALSSETNLDRLRARVTEVLGSMTGATAVRLLLRDDRQHGWVLPDPPGGGPPVSIEEAAAAALVPLSAFHYATRTGEPLVVDDASRDDRFARDPYLAGVERCSLLVVPILNRGVPRAVLLLENRLGSGAFAAGRLGSVMLIAGQLAVSLDNALLYASLEHKVAERTEALEAANQQLELLSATDPLTGLANRRRMTAVLDTEWRRAQRSGRPISIVMIDIDHFKLYNDHYGHLAGDECLGRVADAMLRPIRDNDLLARYGGEESPTSPSGSGPRSPRSRCRTSWLPPAS